MNYTKTAASVQRQIKKAGQAMTLTRISAGAYDPATSSVVTAGTTYTGHGIALNYSQAMIDGSSILQGDQRVYLDPLIGVTPQAGDTLTVGSTIYNVVASKPLSPAGVVVLHEVQVRA